MKTVDDLMDAFGVYFEEMTAGENGGSYWSLLHLLVSLPDICAALEGKPRGGARYVKWCKDYFPKDPTVRPGDRYQMRGALLHEGTTLPAQPTANSKPDEQTQYTSISFVDPRHANLAIHQNVNPDTARQGRNLTIDIKRLADDTRAALKMWFQALQGNLVLNAVVESNLPRLARVKQKVSAVPVSSGPGAGKFQISTHLTTSSS